MKSLIIIIIKKELKRFFTDKRMLAGLFLPGILIFCIYSVMGNVMNKATTPTYDSFTVYAANVPEELGVLLEVPEWEVALNEETLDEDRIIEKIKSKEVDLYIVYEEDFMNKIDAYRPGTSPAPEIRIYYNSTNESSLFLYEYYVSCLDQFENSLSNKFDINRDPEIAFDTADAQDTTVYIFSMMLPFVLLIFLYTGCMSISTESIAGEKERGTIATLLITPTKRSHIVLGKIISLGITGLLSSAVSFIGILLSLPALTGISFSLEAYDITAFVLLLVLIVVTVLLFTSILTIVSTLAKSVKEATSYSSVVMILIMFLAMSNFMISSPSSNPALYFIPIYNISLSLTGLFSMNYEPLLILITVVSNIAYIGLALYLLTKMFNNEKIIFNK